MFNTDEEALFSSKATAGLCSHTYIVDGSVGIGKLDFALYCASAMLCTERNKPCGYCNSCRKIKNSEHPDVHVLGRDKTATVDDVRKMIMRASLKPNDSDKQIFIICNAGKMREEAQNAILKIIEEPPETVAVFLLTESRASLLPTVLSRGQRIHLDGKRDSEISEILRDKYPKLSAKALEAALHHAGGNLGEAERFLSKETATLRAKAEQLLMFAIEKKAYELTSALIVPKYKRDSLYPILAEMLAVCVGYQKEKYGIKRLTASENDSLDVKMGSISKRALAVMCETLVHCMTSLENNANVTSAASKLSIDLLTAVTK